MTAERTYFMIKPDGIHRSLIGRIISRLEEKGYKITAMKLIRIDRDTAEVHYGEHKGKGFFPDLVDFITSGPVVAMVVEGENAVNGVRDLMGKTDPADSPFGTIRGDFGLNLSRNVVHGSDSPASAEREIGIFFRDEEILEYARNDEKWIYP
ncbi:MAG: nucleoside-diphosphate kinase [Thermoplasmatota archaeon]